MKVVGLSSAFAIGLAAIAFANHVDPVHYGDEEGEENNPSCAFLDPSWNELKINQAPNGEYRDEGGGDNPGGDGPLVFTVKNSDGQVFDWESNIGVDAVVVKGGDRGSNVYFYDPEDESDTGLRSPLNKKGNRPAISHISACYDVERQEQPPQGQQEEPPQEEPPQGQGEPQDEPPQEDGGEDEQPQDEGDNERPAEPDEPQQEEQPDEEGAEDRTPPDRTERPGEPEEEQDDGAEAPEQDADDEEQGEGDVEGVSETDEEDVAEETTGTDDGSGDDLPFTGAPLGVLLLIGIVLTLAGVAVRVAQRANPS